jgi:5-hydroxyisourate hydrolase-like protein (transthyretin family)
MIKFIADRSDRNGGPKTLLLFICILLLPVGLNAQAICAYPLQRIRSIEGHVLLKVRPATGATVELYKYLDDERKLISQMDTDGEGGFAIEGIKDGEYVLAVRLQFFSTIVFPIKLSHKIKEQEELMVHLAADVEGSCTLGGVDLQPL